MFDKEKLKGYIDPILLRLLEKGPSYGYEMAKSARERTAGSFELKEATLYLSLKRLEQKGWVASYWSSEESGGGKRKYYKLTEEGRLELTAKKQEWMDVRSVLDAFLKEEKE
ncbi:PadR family transcriptional regulator [Paenibacillus spongiae]|uniref:PadR family transcriptional regulator n=1 Tax=Paenibacillus spongiae TaxID=2909671 RepID=A0ABY5S5A2_9BACL|nr:PadR family transcriptional regulator [Paenibacillus spongiae]UVI28673.1 PadR family transcriptional regulator [Paenibacillus spongiae]